MRRVFIAFAVVLTVAVLVVSTLPWWLGSAMRHFGPRHGLTFGTYEAIGYGRFALTGVTYRRPGLVIAADRVEATTPLVWGWQHLHGDVGVVRVGNWSVKTTPAPRATPASTVPGGFVPLRQQLTRQVNVLHDWLPHAELGAGEISWPGGAASIGHVTWVDRKLSVAPITVHGRRLALRVAVPADDRDVAVTITSLDQPVEIDLTTRTNRLRGRVTAWQNRAPFDAAFPPTGWTPTDASFVALGWSISGAAVQAGAFYQTLGGQLELQWHSGRFSIDTTVHGEPGAAGRKVPPLDVVLRAHGTPGLITVDALNVQSPGVSAVLRDRVTFDRHGQVRDNGAEFRLHADLAELPGLGVTGSIEGLAQLRPDLRSPPEITFSLAGETIVARGVSIAAARAEGRYTWPRLTVTQGLLRGETGGELQWSGGWDFQKKQVTDARVTGQIRRETLARWLPAQPAFAAIDIDAHASGPASALRHSGAVEVRNLVVDGVRPVAVRAQWQGTGAEISSLDAAVTAGHTAVHLGAAVNASAIVLRKLEVEQQGEPRLALIAPATVAWKPALRLSDLRMAGPTATLFVRGSWGAAGQVQLAAGGLPSAWLDDVLTKPVPQGTLQSLAVDATWDNGPATYSIGLTGSALLPSQQMAQVNLAARGDGRGLRIQGLRVAAGDQPVVNATADVPVTISPASAPRVRIDEAGAVRLDLTTAPHAPFWAELGRASGVRLQQPSARLHLTGTWAKPKGDVVARAAGVSFDPARFKRPLPEITELDVHLVATRTGADLQRFRAAVEGQPITASGQVSFPQHGWDQIAKQPLDALRAGTLKVKADDAKIEAFRAFLPKLLVPTGTVTVDAAFDHGALAGKLQLRGASTQAIGPLGIVRDIKADLALDGRRLVVQSVEAQAGGRPVRIGGTVELPDHGTPRYDLSVQAQNVPFVRETGLLVRGDVDLKLQSQPDGGTNLSGTVRLRDSLFLRDFESLMGGGGGGGGAGTPPYFSVKAAPMRDWRVSVTVEGDRFLRLETPVFTGVASMRMDLLGSLEAPRAIGWVRVDDGNVLMPFATFAVQNGSVRLTESDPDRPQLDVTATTRKYGYDLTLRVTGTASSPNIEFSSSPPLESDQILLLVTAGVVPNDAVSTSNSSRALQIGSYLGKGLLGVGGGGENRLRIESGADVSEQGKPTYSVSYELTPRWTAIGEYTRFDEYIADLKWQLWPKPRSPERRKPKPEHTASIDVSGAGWLRDHKLENSLDRLLGPSSPTLDTNAIEDASVILLSAIKDKGYQDAKLDLHLKLQDGSEKDFTFDPTFAHPLPPSLAATKVEFKLTKGTRWHITDATITGLDALPAKKAKGYFHSDDALFNASANAYSPSKLSRAAAALRSDLERLGYADAKVEARVAGVHDGEVKVAVTVTQGPKWTVKAVELARDTSAGVTFPDVSKWIGTPLAPTVRQDIRNSVRQAYYRAGYPDTEISIETAGVERTPDAAQATLRVAVDARPRVTVGKVRFDGNEHTKESVLRARVPVRSGAPIDVLALEKARYRISRLGVFNDVQLRFVPDHGPVRDPVFTVKEAPRFKTSLLAGYGAYEQFRVGIETRQQNLLGRAHQSRVRAVQSMKSTEFDFTYTIPELLGEKIDGTAEVYALRRREIAFLRQEFGTSFALQRALPNTGGAASLRYGFGALANSRSALLTRLTDQKQINVGSLTLSVSGDRRDHPLDPRHGYNWLTRVEVASPSLGGGSTFQRVEISGGYHTSWGGGRWIHLGLSHGLVTTLDANDSTLPVNRRFYPGGANSIRGYQSGEAAPRDAEGRFIGAKSFVLLNVELEQAITPSLSAVVFGDALGEAAFTRDYPWEQRLYSVGVGLRYRTVVGPVRVEYGRNVHRRAHDPSGTWQISVGYPF